MAHLDWEVTIGDRGRVVLPAAVRSALGLEPGTRMLLSTEPDGSVRLRSYRAVAEQSQGMLSGLAPAKTSMVEELLAERRAESAGQDAE